MTLLASRTKRPFYRLQRLRGIILPWHKAELEVPLALALLLWIFLPGLCSLNAQGLSPIRLLNPLSDQVLSRGSTVAWSVTALGIPPFAYQWWKDGVPLADATNSRLSLTARTFADSGKYWLTVSNSAGAVTSRVAQVTVVPAATLRRVGNISGGWVYSFAVIGTALYVGVSDVQAAQRAGLEIWDVSDPGSPLKRGAYRLTGSNPFWTVSDVVVTGDRAYLALGFDGVVVLDIKNPAVPVRVGAIAVPDSALDLAIRSNRLFVATGKGVEVYALDSPTPFVLLGKLTTKSPVYTLTVSGDTLFAAATSNGLQTWNVADPSAPFALGSIPGGSSADTVRLWGDRAFVVGDASLAVVDVRYPAYLVPLGAAQSAVHGNGMAVMGDKVFTGANADIGKPNRLAVFDAVDPSLLFSIGEIATPGVVESVEYVDGRIYSAVSEGGVDIFELGLPSDRPVVLSPVGAVSAVQGTTAELSVIASGGGFLTYQWFKDGTPVSGATQSTLRLPAVSVRDQGSYSVLVGNAAGKVFGGEARLQLTPTPSLSLVDVQLGDSRGPGLNVSAPAGVQGELHGSADFLDWQPLWHGRFGEVQVEVRDYFASNAPARSYRLKLGAR